MNRSSFILGVAMLVVAVTLAVTITVRNAPRNADGIEEAGSTGTNSKRNHAYPAGNSADRAQSARGRSIGNIEPRGGYCVQLPDEQIALLPADERAELMDRAATVESKAREQLERMTGEFDLTGEQRSKMFPMLVRSTAGFDPRMQVGGVYLDSDPSVMPDDEMHGVLDAEQQAQLEDAELDRQLWWQDVFSRLEKDLIDSTGGVAVAPDDEGGVVAPGDNPSTEGEDLVAPASRRGGTVAE